jgi:hypothetical protein
MSTKNNKSVVSQALLEMDAITSAIKEESKNTLNTFLAEAVRNVLREGCEEEDEKDYDVIDEKDNADKKGKKSKKAAKSGVDEDGNAEMEQEPQMPQGQGAPQGQMPQGQMPQGGQEPMAEPQEAPMNGEGGEEGWDEFSEYQSGDDTYDLTGENDYEKVVKVFKLLNDDDQVVVKRDEDTLYLQDNAAGTEYVIDLGADDEMDAESLEGEEMENPEMNLNESEIAGFDDDDDFEDEFDFGEDFDIDSELSLDDEDDDVSFELESDDEEDEFEGDDDSYDDEMDSMWDWDGNLNRFDGEGALGMASLGNDEDFRTRYARGMRSSMGEFDGDALVDDSENNLQENRRRKPMKESKEVLFEVDLGYTDNYQDKDPIAGLSNDEPSKGGKSWHKGVPTGTKKPWAGNAKSKGKPYGNTVNEEDMPIEQPVEENVGGAVKTRTTAKQNMPKGRKAYGPKVGRHISTAGEYEEIVNENKNLKKQVKSLQEAIVAIRKNLSEAYVTNANLGKITKLFLENTTSQSEKVDIVNRFSNEAKTIEQSKALYESIKRELNKTNPTLNINESKTANGTQMINENKVYKSDDLLKTIDLMKRIGNY